MTNLESTRTQTSIPDWNGIFFFLKQHNTFVLRSWLKPYFVMVYVFGMFFVQVSLLFTIAWNKQMQIITAYLWKSTSEITEAHTDVTECCLYLVEV